MRRPPSADVARDAARGGECGGAELRDDAAVERALVEHARRARGVDRRRRPRRRRRGPATSVRKTSRFAPRPSASAAEASSAFTFSGPTASGATTGTLPSASAASSFFGAARQRVADLAERRHGHGEQPVAVAEHRHGDVAERRAQRALTSSIDSRTTSRAACEVRRRPLTNSTGIPRRCISSVICGPAPCTTITSCPPRRGRGSARPTRRDRAADLDDERLTSGTPR